MPTDSAQQETVLLSGASGMLGHAIARALEAKGFALRRLVRRAPSGTDEISWAPDAGGVAGPEQLEGMAAAVHLSGSNVASHRWSTAFKRELTASRVNSTRVLAETLARLKRPPRVLIAASATGFYGNRGDDALDESSPAGHGFFPELCAAWEAASQPAADAGIRVVHLRFGIVLGHGGALERLAPLFRLGLGGPLGNGRQWMSWIGEPDAVSAAMFALESATLAGPLNAVAPNPATNAEFTRQLGRAVHRPALFPAPAFALRVAFGEMADEALLASARVLPTRLLAAGFRFQHPSLAEALRAALG